MIITRKLFPFPLSQNHLISLDYFTQKYYLISEQPVSVLVYFVYVCMLGPFFFFNSTLT